MIILVFLFRIQAPNAGLDNPVLVAKLPALTTGAERRLSGQKKTDSVGLSYRLERRRETGAAIRRK